MTYIATFYTHFGALTFQREQKRQGLNAQMMPVPRLSAPLAACACALPRRENPRWKGPPIWKGFIRRKRAVTAAFFRQNRKKAGKSGLFSCFPGLAGGLGDDVL